MSDVGVVVIGRNEGARLSACLKSVAGFHVVYVDSGSTDGSVRLAMSLDVDVIALDPQRPFSAARARNEGFLRLTQTNPAVEFVQFIDGDCTVVPGWIQAARDFLAASPTCGVACGRRRELFPANSIYNRLCDMEWNTQVGETKACGGDAMIRVSAFNSVNGYDSRVIAGEEPELCVRLRQAGWTIQRLDHDMTFHDAAITALNQWWRRAVRGGYAFAMGAVMHGHTPQRHWVREVRSNWFWGLVLPLMIVILAVPTRGWSLLAITAYVILWFRVYQSMRRRKFAADDSWTYAAFCVLAKFANVVGQIRFLRSRIKNKPSRIIEYKTPQRQAQI